MEQMELDSAGADKKAFRRIVSELLHKERKRPPLHVQARRDTQSGVTCVGSSGRWPN